MKLSLTSSFVLSSIAAIGLATASTLATSNAAQAFTLGTNSNILGDVSGAVQYGIGATDQDSVSNNKVLTVNAEQYFGFGDWNFGGKLGVDSGYGGSGSGKTGTYDFSSIFKSSWEDVMLVFKTGAKTSMIAYKLDENVSSGTWTSPFDIKDGLRDVSHVSVYYREGSSAAVPEPTTMAGIALAGAGLAAYRRRRAAAK